MPRRPVLVLWILTGLNLLNYIDRFVLAAVLPRIEHDLHLGHSSAGMLGTIFLVGYSLTSPFFGARADRGKRTGLIALGVAIWSIATFASGLARGITELAVARAVVGVGEASYATIAPTILDDLAPPEKKSRWFAIFYGAIPVGSALGYVVGGLVEARIGWRGAFFVAGGPGLLLALTCLFLADPPRKELAPPGKLLATVAPLAKQPLYLRAVLGYAAFTFAVGGFGYWGPTFLFEKWGGGGFTLQQANLGMGVVTVIGGALGTAIGGIMGDRAIRARTAAGETGPEARVKVLLRVCAWGTAIGGPIAMLAVMAPSARTFFFLFLAAEIAIFVNSSPVNAAILESVPVHIRASAMALSILAIHVLGDLWSPYLVGLLADQVGMGVAMLLLPLAIGASAALWAPPKEEPEARVPRGIA